MHVLVCTEKPEVNGKHTISTLKLHNNTVYIKILLDCDCLISVQLICNNSAKMCNKLM